MSAKSIIGAVVTGLVLFIFGFLYWGLNPLPYTAWNAVSDPAVAQTQAAAMFPEDGIYFIPGPGNDPEALKLLETGPAIMLTVDHSPTAGADPAALAMGVIHNIATALLLVFVLSRLSGFGGPVGVSVVVGITACFVINGSEVVWWMQPLNWIAYQVIYYLLYFALAGFVLSFFMPKEGEA